MSLNALAVSSSVIDTAQLFFALLTLLCQLFVLAVIVFGLAALLRPSLRPAFRRNVDILRPTSMVFALLVALTTLLGSLFFSEIAHFTPCRLCWIQRSLLYPQVLLCAVLLFKPQWFWLRRLALVLAAVDLPVSIYHFLIERWPSLEGVDVCSRTGPACTSPWFQEFGFITIAYMAFTSALMVGTLLLISRSER